MWKSALLSVQLFLISGVDFIPVIFLFIVFQIFTHHLPMQGLIEQWNATIASWMNAIAWAPNHVTSAVACMMGLILFQNTLKVREYRQKFINTFFIGACFASGLGLSVWVTFTFVIFWAIWMIVLAFRKTDRWKIGWMMFSGSAAFIFALPFILDLFTGGSGSKGNGLPLELYIRPFILTQLLFFLPNSITSWLAFILLPLNYFLELGFFAVIAVQWLRLRRRTGLWDNPYHLAEFLLALTIVILMSFFRSTITNNDLGVRGWLSLQFVLIVWTIDVYSNYHDEQNGETVQISSILQFTKLRPGLRFLLIVGVMTTMLEITVDRSWTILIDSGKIGSPYEVGPDFQIGERTYFAREAYEYANQHLPTNVIYQNNPTSSLDRSSGLYGSRQMVIADRTTYGVSIDEIRTMTNDIGSIFLINYWEWGQIDLTCKKYNIDVLVINDLDPIWRNLPMLEKTRKPIYQNDYYTLIACGDFAKQ